MSENLNNLLNEKIEEYKSKTTTSQKLQADAAKYMPGGSTRTTQWMDPYPFYAKYAKEQNITDVDGNSYLDFMINATSLIHGHASPNIINAIKSQADI